MLLQICLEIIITIRKFVSKLVLCYDEGKAGELILCNQDHDHTLRVRCFLMHLRTTYTLFWPHRLSWTFLETETKTTNTESSGWTVFLMRHSWHYINSSQDENLPQTAVNVAVKLATEYQYWIQNICASDFLGQQWPLPFQSYSSGRGSFDY